jgi:hypothetical protein
MKRLFSLFAVFLFIGTATAKADEFAHIDREVLARAIEKLAEAWTIPMAVFIGATDDFAEEPPFSKPAKPIASVQRQGSGTTGTYSDVEGALQGVFTEEELALVIGEIGRERRLDALQSDLATSE